MSVPWGRSMPGDDLTGRTRHCWRVEAWEYGGWTIVGSASNTVAEARKKQDGFAHRAPGITMRIVRETITYTVEEQS